MGNLLLQFEANSKDGIKDLLRYNLGTKFTDEGCISVTECPSFVQIRLKDVTREGEDLYWVKAVRGQSHTILKRILVTVVNYIITSVGTDATFCVDIIKYTAVEMFRKENGSYKYIAAYMNPIVTPVKDEYEERFTVENGSLVLQKVQPNDTGRYRLKLNHHTEFTREIELTVTVLSSLFLFLWGEHLFEQTFTIHLVMKWILCVAFLAVSLPITGAFLASVTTAADSISVQVGKDVTLWSKISNCSSLDIAKMDKNGKPTKIANFMGNEVTILDPEYKDHLHREPSGALLLKIVQRKHEGTFTVERCSDSSCNCCSQAC
ncbi:uncharacterized protein LOC135360110 isoform X3 [Latimeria chalumnae]|uniref:uncharacterized protein LOC135360110 isoform X3 n=1 Tax=Latimeria chalumnae TaxID=7897 RepID=UPI00313C4172